MANGMSVTADSGTAAESSTTVVHPLGDGDND